MSLRATTDDLDASAISPDLPIEDDACLFRRIRNSDIVEETLPDGTKRKRPTSASFTDNFSHMSLFDSETCGGVAAVMDGHEDFYLASLKASDLRSLGLVLRRTANGGNGHCEAIGKKTGSVRSKLAKAARWVIPPS